MRKTNTAIWMSADGEARATGIGVRLPATRKIEGEELGAEEKVGTRVEVLASSIKLKRRYRAKTRGGAKEAGRGGKTNHHGGGGSQIRDKPSTR
jgi:hypothetical protein